MRILGRLAVPLWLGAIGVIVMYVFFVTLADVSPGQVAGVTIVIAGLAILFTIRSIRVASELSDRGGNPALRRARNRARAAAEILGLVGVPEVGHLACGTVHRGITFFVRREPHGLHDVTEVLVDRGVAESRLGTGNFIDRVDLLRAPFDARSQASRAFSDALASPGSERGSQTAGCAGPRPWSRHTGVGRLTIQ